MNQVPVFAIDTTLSGEVLAASLPLGGIFDIALDDRYIFIAGYTGDEWLHIYDHAGRFIRKCIHSGKGPSEMLLLGNLETIRDGRIVLWDSQTRRRTIHPIDSLLVGNVNCGVSCDDPVLPDDFTFTSVYYVSPDRWLYLGHNGWGKSPIARFQLVSNGRLIAAYGRYPADSASDAFWDVWRSATSEPKVAVSPDGTKMAHGLIYGCILETFSFQGDTIRPIAVQQIHRPYMIRDMGVRGTDDCWYGFPHLSATDQRIYGIYVGQKSTEAGNTPNSLVVFDWEGQPLARYRTDYCLVALAAVPKAEQSEEAEVYAVGISPADAEWKLLRFILP